MVTKIRPEIRSTHKYWISKHRYYELKHFCLQYPEWKKAYIELEDSFLKGHILSENNTTDIVDITSKYAISRAYYYERIMLVDNTAITADKDICYYLLRGVTEDLSYTYLKSRLEIPCGKDLYYDRYRKFFWLLSNSRK